MKKTLLFILLFIFQQIKAQDTCIEAVPITAGYYTVDAINGTDVPSPICAENGTGATAGEWYSYTPTQNYSVTVSTELQINLNKDTRIHIYSGTCSSLTCIAGDDDAGSIGTGYLSIVNFNVAAGTTYMIAFDNRWNSSGFDFQLIESPIVIPPISFTSQQISISPTICNVADMNGDFLDDITYVEGNQITILTQKTVGGFDTIVMPLSTYVLTPDWSIAAGDFDRNGFNDLALGNGSRLTILKANETGTNFSIIAYPQSIFTQRTNFVDINNDGNLDLWACHDVAQSHAYKNDGIGNLNFDISLMPTLAIGGNYQSLWIDYDNDGDMDMYLSKCRGGAAVGDPQRINLLYKNNGDGTFSECGATAGVNDGSQSWSTAIEDFDNDGDLDILLSNISDTNKFYLNNGDGTFTDIYATTGIDAQVGSWELQAADFNNDGFMDFIWQNGKEIYLNNGDLTFSGYDINFNEGGIGDLNNDGFLDVQFANYVYYNVPNGNNWVKINLKGITSNSNGIGARIEIYGAWGKQIREIRSGHGFSHMSSLNAYFGIGTATEITKIVVKWPSGIVDTLWNPTINSAIFIPESSTLNTVINNYTQNLTVYPNPTSNYLKIHWNQNENIPNSATIYDVSGKKIKEEKITNNTVSVQNLQKGTYILEIKNEKGKKYSCKFIKE